MTNEELAEGLGVVTTKLQKIGAETQTLLQKISDLETTINNTDNVPQAVVDQFNALKAQADVVDALVPDADDQGSSPTV